MASRSPAGKTKPPPAGSPQPAHLLFKVGGQGYLLTYQFKRPDWAQMIDSHAKAALPILRRAAREVPGFTARLRTTFGHDVAPVGRDKTADPAARVAMLIERHRLFLFRLGQAPPAPPQRVADLRLDVPPVKPVAANPNAAAAPSDLPSRVLIVVEGMKNVPPKELGRDAAELIGALLVAGAAFRIAAVIAAWIASHFTPVGWLVDAGMIGYGVWMVGLGFIDSLRRLLVIARAIRGARTVGELKAQSAPLAKLLLEAGLTAMLAFFLKGLDKRKGKGGASEEAPSSPPPRKSAPVPGKAAAPPPPAPAKPPASSPLTPGGGLAQHEAKGGHLIAKHVGKTEQELKARLASDPRITGSSSFYDRAGAERAVSETLKANDAKINQWLSTSQARLPIDHTLPGKTGISVARGAANAVDVSSAKVILVRDATMADGYRILTGYPTKP